MGAFLVVLSALGFSTLGIFGRFAYDAGFSRDQMLFWRFLFALPFFAGLLRLNRISIQSKKRFLTAMALGFVGIGIEASLYFLTLVHLGAALTGIFLYLYPAFVAIFSHFFLGKRLSVSVWLCIALSLVGCFLTAGLSTDPSAPSADRLGILYGILTGLWYAVYLLCGERVMKDENPLVVSSGIVSGSLLVFAILSFSHFASVPLKVPAGWSEWCAIAGLALIATVLPFSTLYVGMKRVGATQASLLSTLEMVFTIVLAAVFLGEKLTLVQIFGAALILLSVLLIQRLRTE